MDTVDLSSTGHLEEALDTWKKLVWEGSRPVLPAGTVTSTGATRPTRAGAPTCSTNGSCCSAFY